MYEFFSTLSFILSTDFHPTPPPPPPEIRLAVARFKIALVSIRKPLRLKNHVFFYKKRGGCSLMTAEQNWLVMI